MKLKKISPSMLISGLACAFFLGVNVTMIAHDPWQGLGWVAIATLLLALAVLVINVATGVYDEA